MLLLPLQTMVWENNPSLTSNCTWIYNWNLHMLQDQLDWFVTYSFEGTVRSRGCTRCKGSCKCCWQCRRPAACRCWPRGRSCTPRSSRSRRGTRDTALAEFRKLQLRQGLLKESDGTLFTPLKHFLNFLKVFRSWNWVQPHPTWVVSCHTSWV